MIGKSTQRNTHERYNTRESNLHAILQTVQQEIILAAIDYAGLTTNCEDMKSFLRQMCSDGYFSACQNFIVECKGAHEIILSCVLQHWALDFVAIYTFKITKFSSQLDE